MDLDWGTWRGATALAPARMGLLEPVDRLGLDAVATADVVLVPGLAVSASGDRLGQGGGCYDRVLGRIPVGTPVVICLYDDEVGLDVPVDDHDRPVTAARDPHPLDPPPLTAGLAGRSDCFRRSSEVETRAGRAKSRPFSPQARRHDAP